MYNDAVLVTVQKSLEFATIKLPNPVLIRLPWRSGSMYANSLQIWRTNSEISSITLVKASTALGTLHSPGSCPSQIGSGPRLGIADSGASPGL
mgnify:CR=1 FL=1